MEIKIENIALKPVFEKFEELEAEKISLGVKHRIKKIKAKLAEHYKSYNESHVELIIKHGGVTDDNKNTSLSIIKSFKFYDKDNKKIDVCKIIINKTNFEAIYDKLQSIRDKWNIKKQLIEYDQKIQLIKDMNNVLDCILWKDGIYR